MKIRVKDVVNATADELGIGRKSIRSGLRFRELTRARQIAAGLSKRLVVCSTSQIGKEIGCDHSTIVHSLKVAEFDEELAEKVRQRAQALADEWAGQFRLAHLEPTPRHLATGKRARAYEDGMWSVHG